MSKILDVGEKMHDGSESMSNLKVVILGGDGFIGNYFAKHQHLHDDVLIISRKKTLYIPNEIVFRDMFSLPENIFEHVNIVYNFLGLAHVSDKKNNEVFYKVNYSLVLELAAKAAKAGVKKFVHMSSVSVYGLKESVSLVTKEEPDTHYGKSKLFADRALLDMSNDKFQVLILRPPMIYGLNSPGNMKRLIELVIKLPVLPFKNATKKRDFLCIHNFICILESMIQKGSKGVHLLKDTESFSTLELVRMICSTLNFSKPIINLPFASIVEKIFHSEYAKLYEGMNVDVAYDIQKVTGLINPRTAFCSMVEKYQSN